MPRKPPPEQYRFKKGQVSNPKGRPRLPKELRKIKPYISEEIERLIAKYLRLEFIDFDHLVKDIKEHRVKITMTEALIVRMIAKAFETGDPAKFEFLLTRMIGRVKFAPGYDPNFVPPVGDVPEAPEPVEITRTEVVVYIPSNGREVTKPKVLDTIPEPSP